MWPVFFNTIERKWWLGEFDKRLTNYTNMPNFKLFTLKSKAESYILQANATINTNLGELPEGFLDEWSKGSFCQYGFSHG